jgi:phage portal protein BeeE
MAETSLIRRFQNAMQVLRGAKAVDGVPDFSQGTPYLDRFSSPFWRHSWSRNTQVNYKQEVGSLDGHSLVACVVNYTGTRLPEAKPVIRRTNKAGEIETDPNHALAQLIRRPNNHHVWANYAHACSVSWWIDGNVYFKMVRDLTGQVVELWYVPHYLIEPRWPNDRRTPEVPREKNQDPFLSHYQFNVPGKAPELWPARDVLHLKRGALTEDRKAQSPFEPLVKELYGDDKMALFTASIMRNMGIQVPMLSPKENVTLDPEEAAHLKAQWLAKTTGDRVGEPVINTIPITAEKFGFSPSELDLSALRMIPESRVAAVTGIPAATLQLMVGLQNGTSYASSEQARQQGYEEVVIPIQQVWAEEINWQLLPEFDDAEGAEFWFDTSNVRVLEEDKDALVKREAEVFRAGGTTYDQFLTSIGKKPVGAPLGDVRLVPGLSSPMSPERLIEMATKPPETTPLNPTPEQVDQASLAKLADIDAYLASLERQMKEFVAK